MKSLEIVKKNKLKIDGWNECVLVGKDLEQIIKDLEVLEILKKYIPENWSGFQIIMSDKKTKWEDWKKVEQWLEENEHDN